MHLGGKYKMSWSNDDLVRFLTVWALCGPPHESIRSQGAIADRVNLHLTETIISIMLSEQACPTFLSLATYCNKTINYT